MAESAVTSSGPATVIARPAAVTVVTALAVLAGVYLVVDSGLDLRGIDRDDTSRIVFAVLEMALGFAAFLVAVGALRVRPWAWKLFMIWAVVGLTTQILRYFSFGDPAYVRMALYAFIVFALTPRDVQVAFRIRQPANVDLSRATRNPLDRD
jgi:hypothetical protein